MRNAIVKLKAGRQSRHSSSSNPKTTSRMPEAVLYRELKTWKPFRMFGLCAALAALALTVATICNGHWISGPGYHVGIWENCRFNISSVQEERHLTNCTDAKPTWQNAVIGLLIFAVAFGFLATLLSMCGVCTSALTKRVYYYHSAGEIYFICALSMVAALICYPVAIAMEDEMLDHSYSYGYGLGWGATFFYLAAAMCMCLDDVVRALTRGRCCGKDNGADTRV